MDICDFCDLQTLGKGCKGNHHPHLYLEVEMNSYVIYCLFFKPTLEAKEIAQDG